MATSFEVLLLLLAVILACYIDYRTRKYAKTIDEYRGREDWI
jgi:hypothetical protein